MTGKVIRVVDDKGFGFIHGENNVDYFFHHSGFDGHWRDLVSDLARGKSVEVEFEEVSNPKGPRAEGVRRLDGGV